MATLTVTKASRAGATRNKVAAAGGGDDFPNDGKTVFIVDNGGGSACECSFALDVDPHSAEPTQSTSATAISVGNGDEDIIGPFPRNKFGASVAVTYNQVTSVTVEAVSIA